MKTALILVFVAIPMVVQAQTTVDCNTVGSQTHCNSYSTSQQGVNVDFSKLTTPDFSGDYQRSYQEGQLIAAQRRVAEQQQLLIEQQQAVDAERAELAQQNRENARASESRSILDSHPVDPVVWANFCKTLLSEDYSKYDPQVLASVTKACSPPK